MAPVQCTGSGPTTVSEHRFPLALPGVCIGNVSLGSGDSDTALHSEHNAEVKGGLRVSSRTRGAGEGNIYYLSCNLLNHRRKKHGRNNFKFGMLT